MAELIENVGLVYELMSVMSDRDLMTICRLNKQMVERCQSNRLIRELLVDREVEYTVKRYGPVAILPASHWGRIKVVERLLVCHPPPHYQQQQGLVEACRNGHLNVVERLMVHPKTDPSYFHNFAIQIASQNGHMSVVRHLMADPRVNPGDDGNLAIILASTQGQLEVVELLLTDPRVDPSHQSNRAIKQASKNVKWNVVKRLLADPRVAATYCPM